MKKVLIAYFSTSGKTEKMSQYIAEGVRFNGLEAVVKSIQDIRAAGDLDEFDGYIIGSPTFSLDIPQPVQKFLDMSKTAKLTGKLCGAFGSYTHDVAYRHDNYAPNLIFNILRNVNKMEPFELGPFSLQESMIETGEGMKACHDYGRRFGQKLTV
jgi:flavorubredoxin